MKVAAVQLRTGTDPADNATTAARLVREAADAGAVYIQTPEVTNLMQRNRAVAHEVISDEAGDVTLATLREVAAEKRVTVHIGSIVLREGGTLRNRALVIGPGGEILARYDKIHLFDVTLPNGESYRESKAYTGGARAVLCDLGKMKLGVAICFDVRFPALFGALAEAGANVLTAPSAFAQPTGAAHWHTLMRARAIENGAFMIAAAQEGRHDDGRLTYGHSIIVDPWGRILAEADATPSVIYADLDLGEADRVRQQIPVISARRDFTLERTALEPA